MIAKKGIVAVLFIFWLLSVGHADWFEKNSKMVRANLIGSAAIVSWGYFTWDYGTRKPHFAHEGWFGKDTKHAGMDKLGHLYTNDAVTHLLAQTGAFCTFAQRVPAVSGVAGWILCQKGAWREPALPLSGYRDQLLQTSAPGQQVSSEIF